MQGRLRPQTQCNSVSDRPRGPSSFVSSQLRFQKQEQLQLFKAACSKHDKLMGEASNNAGCDRHLLGLRLLADELRLELPEIYKDVAWTKS